MRRQSLADVSLGFDIKSLGMFLFLLPVFYYHIMVSFSFGTLLLIGCSFLVLCIFTLPQLQLIAMGTSYRMLFWILVVILTCINNGYLEHQYLVYFFSLPLAIITAYSLQYDTQWHQPLLKTLNMFIVLNCIIAWLLWLLPGFYVSKIVPLFPVSVRGTLIRSSNQHILMGLADHYSTSGMLFALSLIFYAASWFSKERKEQDLVMILIMGISLMMTQKRGPLLFAAATIIFLYFLSSGMSVEKLMQFGMIGAAALIFFFLAVRFLPDLQRVLDRFTDDGDVTSGRSELYAYAWELFQENKLLGVGWGQYRFLPGSDGLQVHNIYLQILAETGLVGFFSFLIGFSTSLVSTIKKILVYRKNPANTAAPRVPRILMVSAAIQINFVLYGLTGNPIYDMQCMYPYFLAVAINESLSVQERNHMTERNRSTKNGNRYSYLRKNK